MTKIQVQRQGNRWGVFAVSGNSQTLIEGGFFSRLEAQRCKDEHEAERLIPVKALANQDAINHARHRIAEEQKAIEKCDANGWERDGRVARQELANQEALLARLTAKE